MNTDWMDRAACAGADVNLFFPTSMDSIEAHQARALCARCPVAEDCYALAVSRDERWGVWGGSSPTQRTRAKRAASPREAPVRRSDLGRTHCRHGHEYTPENTVWAGGFRKCRACREAAKQRQNERIRAVKAAALWTSCT